MVFVEGKRERVDLFIDVMRQTLGNSVLLSVKQGDDAELAFGLGVCAQVMMPPRVVFVRGYGLRPQVASGNEGWFSMEQARCVLCSVDLLPPALRSWCVLDVAQRGEYNVSKVLRRMASSPTDKWHVLCKEARV